jgi:hypothetical protein
MKRSISSPLVDRIWNWSVLVRRLPACREKLLATQPSACASPKQPEAWKGE